MFKIYDLDMKEIPFPDGVMPLEIFVGSIGKDRVTEAVDGRAGVVDYGFNYTDRPVSLFLRIKAKDKIDFRLLRNEVFATFDVGSEFYVAESDVPSRVLKVVVDESYIPDRLTEEYADFDINCRTLDSVFWESTYTTLELHDSGYSATAEKYGLVDNIDDEKVKYRFEDEKEVLQTIDLTDISYIYGFISGTGNVSGVGTSSYTINEGFIDLVEDSTYRFIDRGDSPQLNYWWLYMYNDDESFIERIALIDVGGGREYTFIASGTKMKVMINPVSPMSDNKIDPSRIGIDVLPELNLLGATKFKVYNAGNVTVEPESMYLHIIANTVTTPGGFTIANKTTGEEFVFNEEIKGSSILIRGMDVRVSSIYNRFRDTNRRFISLAPGDNEFEVSGGTFNHIRFDFKYLYK